MSFAIMRVEKRKDIGSVRRCAEHHLRTVDTPNADPSRGIRVLAGSTDSNDVIRLINDVTKPLMRRKDAVRAIDVFCGTSPDFFANGGSIEEFEKVAMQWASDTFGAENLALVVTHEDETTPHVQMLVTPITPKGKLSASYWLDGPKMLAAMQDSFAEAMQPLGLERGVKGSKAKHEDIKRFYGELQPKMQAATVLIEQADVLRDEIALKTHQNSLQAIKNEESRIRLLESQERLKSRSERLDERVAALEVRESLVEKMLAEIQHQKNELMRVIQKVPAGIQAMIRDVFHMQKPEKVVSREIKREALKDKKAVKSKL